MPLPSRFGLVAFLLLLVSPLSAQFEPPKLAVPYGNNPATGKFAEVNGIKLYYETYGDGPVMLQIHGNGDSIAGMGYQIQFFSPKYRVIATDSRGHGKSEPGSGRLTYEQMAEDLNALLDRLQLKSVIVLGWSDGGILGLLLAIHHPDKVSKLAIMGTNLNPQGAYQWALDGVAKGVKEADAMIAKGDTSQPWQWNKQLLDLLGQQPNIPVSDLEKIAIPVLVMAADKDVIRADHTQLIFEHLKQAHLAIFPGATHMIPRENHLLFNETVARFFAEPFARPDTRTVFGM
ncbi:MAG TPA: alpha/beta hydrolase [Lacunisphaera sp.]|nr:alpha/beta hydrolase [Lacunisphaera sp.]